MIASDAAIRIKNRRTRSAGLNGPLQKTIRRRTYRILLSALMHLAQYVCFVGTPFSITVTRCRLGWKGRLVCRFECETACPNVTALPQLLHFAIGVTSLSFR